MKWAIQSIQRIQWLSFLVIGLIPFVSCVGRPPHRNAELFRHEDGTYRGVFLDEDQIQVGVEFTLNNGLVTHAGFRHLDRGDGNYHLATEEEPYRSVIAQYQEALDHLVGKPLSEHLPDLYEPGRIVQTEVDGYTGATIRANKVLSAIRDGLNRGVYQY